MAEKFSLKDHLFNKEKVTKLAQEIQEAYPQFDSVNFISSILIEFPKLELKQRISHITEMLKENLPRNYPEALNVILHALPEKNDTNKTDNDFGDFIYAPYTNFVAQYGRSNEHLTISLEALREITMRFSAEDSIRYFINEFPKETYEELLKWSKDSNYHVRRLASEGTRPKLPWSQKITVLPDNTLPILDNLFHDSTRYVTRSVANHLNDLSRIKPELVISTLKKWQKSGRQNEKEMSYITSHSLRTLIKQGYDSAFELLGYSSSTISISNFNISNPVYMNQSLEFSFSLTPDIDESIIIDYRINFQNKKGEMKSEKVFKLKKLSLKKDAQVKIFKKHKLNEFMTTRTLYPGIHKLSILINGKSVLEQEFKLKRN
jgi:3-methyladenine DNA glycosylase AlkC